MRETTEEGGWGSGGGWGDRGRGEAGAPWRGASPSGSPPIPPPRLYRSLTRLADQALRLLEGGREEWREKRLGRGGRCGVFFGQRASALPPRRVPRTLTMRRGSWAAMASGVGEGGWRGGAGGVFWGCEDWASLF